MSKIFGNVVNTKEFLCKLLDSCFNKSKRAIFQNLNHLFYFLSKLNSSMNLSKVQLFELNYKYSSDNLKFKIVKNMGDAIIVSFKNCEHTINTKIFFFFLSLNPEIFTDDYIQIMEHTDFVFSNVDKFNYDHQKKEFFEKYILKYPEDNSFKLALKLINTSYNIFDTKIYNIIKTVDVKEILTYLNSNIKGKEKLCKFITLDQYKTLFKNELSPKFYLHYKKDLELARIVKSKTDKFYKYANKTMDTFLNLDYSELFEANINLFLDIEEN